MTAVERPAGAQSPFDSIRRTRDDGSEFWSARELMPVMCYSAWRNFMVPIERAMKTAENQGAELAVNFVGSRKISETKPAEDFELSRFAAYLVAMNGDPNKPEVASAQAYFAIQTRVAETAPPALSGPELLAAALIESQRVLEARETRINQLEVQQVADAPAVLYVAEFVTDADTLTFSTVASSCGITEKALRALLIERDWIYVQTDSRWSNSKGRKIERNRYSEKATKKRHFQRIVNHEAPRFRGGEVMHTLKITPFGAAAIARLVQERAS